jgi:hypothetical protein
MTRATSSVSEWNSVPTSFWDCLTAHSIASAGRVVVLQAGRVAQDLRSVSSTQQADSTS